MIPHLSADMMLQSLWRRGQQQWRDVYCSHGLLTAATQFFVNTARVNRASVRRPRRQFESSPAGARQKKIRTIVHDTYQRLLIQNIRTCRPSSNTTHTHTQPRPKHTLLHTNKHDDRFHTHDNDASPAEAPREATRREY